MASLLRRAMVYLGLVDDDYDEYDPYEEAAAPVGQPQHARTLRPVPSDPEPTYGASVRPLGREPVMHEPSSGVTVTPNRSGSVRPLAPSQAATVHIVAPKVWADAQEIGDRFKNTQPVLVNLQSVDRDFKRRLLDFCAGLVFGLEGQIKPVAGNDVVLLTPTNVEVSEQEKRRLQERGLYRPS